jgi:hypothetical protein
MVVTHGGCVTIIVAAIIATGPRCDPVSVAEHMMFKVRCDNFAFDSGDVHVLLITDDQTEGGHSRTLITGRVTQDQVSAEIPIGFTGTALVYFSDLRLVRRTDGRRYIASIAMPELSVNAQRGAFVDQTIINDAVIIVTVVDARGKRVARAPLQVYARGTSIQAVADANGDCVLFASPGDYVVTAGDGTQKQTVTIDGAHSEVRVTLVPGA